MTTETERYVPAAYLVAGFYLAISDLPADAVRNLNRKEDFFRLFRESFGKNLDWSVLDDVLGRMHLGNLLIVDQDEYAGTFISAQKTQFQNVFKAIADSEPGSPLAKALRGRRPWLESVFSSEKFWQEVDREQFNEDEDGEMSEGRGVVPASDRVVTLLHNSPERIEIDQYLAGISEELRTSNQVAADLGDDRERITAEFEAASVGVRAEKIRSGFIKDTVLKVLRELSGKLKDKAIELGVDRLIALFEAIMENFL